MVPPILRRSLTRRDSSVAVKFLSPEWAEAVKTALNADDAFRQAASGKKAVIQQVINAPEGPAHYWIKIDDGAIDMGLGDAEGADSTITDPRKYIAVGRRAIADTVTDLCHAVAPRQAASAGQRDARTRCTGWTNLRAVHP